MKSPNYIGWLIISGLTVVAGLFLKHDPLEPGTPQFSFFENGAIQVVFAGIGIGIDRFWCWIRGVDE